VHSRLSWTTRTGLVVACTIGLCTAAVTAQPAALPAGYQIVEKWTQTSPDGAIAIEQYANRDKDDDWTWQFWVRRQGALALLDPEPAGNPADFVFTGDLKWIIRVQRYGTGEATLHLYRLTPQGYVRASQTPLGERAWDYMKSRPDWRKIVKTPEYHRSAYLVEGLGESYRGLGVDWPANRYLLITLSGEADVRGRKREQTGVVNGWRCRYDLETGKFDVPEIFSRDNAKAVLPQ
jgi:hypothetical protein